MVAWQGGGDSYTKRCNEPPRSPLTPWAGDPIPSFIATLDRRRMAAADQYFSGADEPDYDRARLEYVRPLDPFLQEFSRRCSEIEIWTSEEVIPRSGKRQDLRSWIGRFSAQSRLWAPSPLLGRRNGMRGRVYWRLERRSCVRDFTRAERSTPEIPARPSLSLFIRS